MRSSNSLIYLFMLVFVILLFSPTSQSSFFGNNIERYDENTFNVVINSNIKYLSSILWTDVKDVQVVNDLAYCAFGNGLVILNVSDQSNPVKISELYLEAVTYDIVVRGNYAYMATGLLGLAIIDISDPFNPYLLETYGTPKTVMNVFVDDSLAYVTIWESSTGQYLQIVSISDPSNPYLLGSCDISDWTHAIFVKDSLAYAPTGSLEGLQILSVSDPSNPYLLTSFTDGGGIDVFVRDSLAYVAASSDGLNIISVSDPLNPYILGSYDTPRLSYAVFIKDSIAYVADFNSLQIISVSDPSDPYLLGSFALEEYALGVFMKDGLAHVASGPNGLNIISVSNSSNPTLLGSYNTPGFVKDVSVQDSLAYAAALWTGLYIISFSDPSNPYVLANYDTPGDAIGVFVRDSLVYVADGNSGLHIISVANPSEPKLLGSYDTPGFARNLFIQDSLAYVADGSSLQIISIVDPSTPYPLGGYAAEEYARGVFVKDSLVYLADGNKGIKIISVSDPSNPYLLQSYNTFGSAHDVFVKDSLAYVADYFNFQIISVSDPLNPYVLGSFDTPHQYTQTIFVQDNLAYLGDWNDFMIVSVSDPTKPYLLDNYYTPGRVEGIFIQDSLAFIADFYSLIILRMDYIPQIISLDFDIKPQSCPNPLNTKSKGVLPVGILGSDNFNVKSMDPTSILLEGVAPIRWNYEDVAAPAIEKVDSCDCTTEGSDGFMDLTLKFKKQDIVASLYAQGKLHDGETKILTFTGLTKNGTQIEGYDCVIIKHKELNPSQDKNDKKKHILSLNNNYPNPFNLSTSISFYLLTPSDVELTVYNILGQEVKIIANERFEAGHHTLNWDGTNESGFEVASGIYLYKISSGDNIIVKKMSLLK